MLCRLSALGESESFLGYFQEFSFEHSILFYFMMRVRVVNIVGIISSIEPAKRCRIAETETETEHEEEQSQHVSVCQNEDEDENIGMDSRPRMKKKFRVLCVYGRFNIKRKRL